MSPRTEPQSFTMLQKILIVGLLLGVGVALWYFFQVRGATQIAQTIASNTSLENGLLVHYTFDGTNVDWSNTTAEIRDSSGNDRHGNATSTMSSAHSPAPGVLGQAMRFGPVERDKIDIPYNIPDAPITFSAWVFLDESSSGIRNIVGRLSNWSEAYGYGMYINSSNQLVGIASNNNHSWYPNLTSSPLAQSTWTHVAFTLDGWGASATGKLYVNGVLEDTYTNTASSYPYQNMVGCGGHSSTAFARCFNGLIDDVRIYDRVLSEEELKRLYELGATTKIAQTLTTNPTLEDGLVGYWTFDGQDIDWGSTTAEVRDAYDNSWFGDAQGLTSARSPTIGVIGQALWFDNEGDAVNLGTRAVSSGAITVAAWVNPDESNAPYVAKWNSAAGGRSFILSTNNRNVYFSVSDDGSIDVGARLEDLSNSKLVLGEWAHVVATFDGNGGVMRIFVNGTQDASAADPLVTGIHDASATPLLLGYSQPLADSLHGSLDDVRIYDRVLSAEEVRRLYELGATTYVGETLTTNPTLEDGLVGHWTFDGQDVDWASTTAEIKDRSGQGNHGDAQGGMSAATSPTIGVIGQGMRFDGLADYIDTNNGSSADDLTALTYAMWVYKTQSGNAYLLSKSTNGGGSERFYIESDALGVVIANNTGPEAGRALSTDTIPVNQWAHVAATYEHTGVKKPRLYINGSEVEYSEQDSLASLTLDTDSVGDFLVAVSPWNSQFFHGTLDDVRIYNRALSAEEVRRLYELGN